MKQYQDLVKHILDNGEFKGDRTGTGTYSVFGYQMRFDLREGFPLVTTKFTPIGAIIKELLWFRDGETNIKHHLLGGAKIWDEWALEEDYVVEEEYTINELLSLYAKKSGIPFDKALNEYRGICAVMSKAGVSAATLKSSPENIDQEIYARTKLETITKDDVIAGVLRANENLRSRLGLARNAKKNRVAKAAGEIGPMYGFIWRNFGGVDQLKEVIENLRKRPTSRRHLVSAWDPSKLPDESVSPQENVRNGKGCLAPCHAFFQFNAVEIPTFERAKAYNRLYPNKPVAIENYLDAQGEEKFPSSESALAVVLDNHKAPTHHLDLQLYQRSADVGLGVPFNIASYAALLVGVAHELNYVARHYVHTFGDAHIYSNHLGNKLEKVLERDPRPLPKLVIDRPVGTPFLSLVQSDFRLEGYDSHEKIPLPISV